jgi:hypothetical protein
MTKKKSRKRVKMEKRNIIIIGVGVLIILVLAFFLIVENHTPPKEKKFFTPEPESWAEENTLTENKEDVRISLMKATEGKSTFSGNKLQYFEKGEESAFFFHGAYQGTSFDTTYLNPEFYKLNTSRMTSEEIKKEMEKNKIMEITQYLNPEDGIIQIFVVAKKDSRGFVFYIYADEDWKQKLEFTNIIYGNSFRDAAGLIERPFNFQEISPGLYMDKIEDYNGWYDQDPVTGGLAIGKVNAKDLQGYVNSTFIMMR